MKNPLKPKNETDKNFISTGNLRKIKLTFETKTINLNFPAYFVIGERNVPSISKKK